MKRVKKYKEEKESVSIVSEPEVAYGSNFSNPISYQRSYSDYEVVNLIKNGLPKQAFDRTMSMMNFTLDDMSNLLHVSERTLRRYDENSVLNVEQSERIVELNNLYSYGMMVFGDIELFKKWIDSPILALGQKTPKEFLDTSFGITMLKNILGRIEHGVYS